MATGSKLITFEELKQQVEEMGLEGKEKTKFFTEGWKRMQDAAERAAEERKLAAEAEEKKLAVEAAERAAERKLAAEREAAERAAEREVEEKKLAAE